MAVLFRILHTLLSRKCSALFNVWITFLECDVASSSRIIVNCNVIRSLLQNGEERCCGSNHYNPEYDICCQDQNVYKKSDVSSGSFLHNTSRPIPEANACKVHARTEKHGCNIFVCGCDLINESRCKYHVLCRWSDWNIIMRKNIIGHCHFSKRSVLLYNRFKCHA